MNNQQPRRDATMNDLLYALEQILDEQVRTRQAIEAQASANEPALYCPPDEHCPGGVRLMKHAPKYWKNDGEDKDRFYHPLPESAYWIFRGEGAFNGNTVKNHNVWRSQALTEGGESADAYPDVDHETGEIREPDGYADRHREAAPTDAPPMANAGDFLLACNRQLRMHKQEVLDMYGVERGEDLPRVMAPYLTWEALFEDTKRRQKAPAAVAGLPL